MQTSVVLAGRPVTPVTLLLAFARWYILEMPIRIVRYALDELRALFDVFSFVFLLRTLVSPWKNITDAYPAKGFNINRILETFTLNVTARAIGFVIRLATILIGSVLELLCVIAFIAWLLLWVAFPLFLIPLLGYLFLSLFS